VKEIQKELVQHPVTLELEKGLPLVRLDFILMQQILSNLLLNAAVHTPQGTPVQIKGKVEAKTLLLTVADTGPGLPADALARVFDKFYRAPAARAGGTGLGLSIVKGFVEAQGGQIKAENQAGGGALFTIRLPLSDVPPVSAETNV
jgi:two-component system sensor histidine kinase KdpD